jgi:hypothetical protein
LTRTFSLRLEWTIGLILCGVVFAGTRMGVPPFSSLLAFTEDVRGRWEARAARPPVAHAELLTLSELAAEAGFDLANALTRLEARKITGAEPHARVEDVAKQNGLSAQQLYDIMSGRSTTPADSRGGGAMRGRSGGFGQRTLADFCEAEGIDLGLALSRLEDSGLHGSADQTIREITVNAGLDRPNEVLQIIREGR